MNNGNGASKPSKLAVQKGKQKGARRFLIYGPQGVGKTTLAAHAPKPIFGDLEEGSHELDVDRLLFSNGQVTPATYEDLIETLATLATENHAYQTLVIDSIDRLESLIWDHCLRRDSGKPGVLNKSGRKLDSIESYGFGKGYNVALDVFRSLLAQLESIQRTRWMNIVFIGHTQIRPFKNPEGEDYDRYWLRVHASLGGLVKEWVDVVGFACFETFGDRGSDEQRAKGYSTGRRLLKLTHAAAYDAKSRLAMPNEIELDAGDPWAPIQAAMDAGETMTPDAIRAAIEHECKRIDDSELTKKALNACKGVKDTTKLSRYLMYLKGRSKEETVNG